MEDKDKKEISTYEGLSEMEAEAILKTEGYNELPSQGKQSGFAILARVLSEPMLLLLLAAGSIYFFMGEKGDSILLLFSVLVVVGITFYQEKKTERTLEALRDLSSPRALVVRDGEQRRIAGREVVTGDLIIIHEGDRVPADAVVLSCENLGVDESLLTGESMPVRKKEWDGKIKNQRPGGDDLPFIYSGSLVTSGRGVAQVIFTGLKTEIGKIGKSLESIKEEDTLLKKEITKIVRVVSVVGLMLCLLVLLYYVLFQNDLITGLLSGLTLSMAILPEEFPIVLVIFMTLGAWRISKRKVLTRRAATIETLGAATVLCTDKTGTLTLNKMELSSLYADGGFYELSNFASTDLPDKFKTLLEYGVLSSQKDPFDPLERELRKMGTLYLKNMEKVEAGSTLIREYPIRHDLLALSHVWQKKETGEKLIASKGAPEAILDLCHSSPEEIQAVLERVREMSEKGLRVLGVARAVFLDKDLPTNQHDFKFDFVGLLGFVDPVRSTVPEAVRETYAAGMRIIMITGDYPGTAQYIGRKIGLKNPDKYLTGEDLEKMNHQQLREKIKDINVFARIVPEQKLLIVNALKANNEIVAMTGDGVNDAPALKSAHIGVAMGERGTDVAREASSLVLLNDDFSSIVSAVRLGRRIYDNLRGSIGYLLAVHVPIAGMAVLPLFFDLPIVLLPAHVAFMELIIDPACSTVFESESEDKNIMKRPPRDLRRSIFNFKNVSISLIQGFGVLVAVFLLYVYVIKSGRSVPEARSFAFVSLILSNLMLIAINLSWSKGVHRILFSASRILIIVFISAVLCLLAVLYIPFLAELFHLAPLHPQDFLLIISVVLISLIWFEGLKFFWNRRLTANSVI